MAQFHLVLIETGANQDYIFGSNRLREVVGASELLHRIGTKRVVEAVDPEAARKIWPSQYSEQRTEDNQSRKPELKLKDYLVNQPRIEDDCKTNPDAVEIVIATSGKALILTCKKEAAKRIVTAVTKRALKEAPGVTVVGAIAVVEGGRAKDLDKAGREGHLRREGRGSLLPGPEAVFPP